MSPSSRTSPRQNYPDAETPGALGSDAGPRLCCTDLGALYVVVQVVPEGVDEVDGVVSGIGVGVTWEQD